MDAKGDVVEQFLSWFHATRLKPAGYKKKGHAFSRKRADFSERIQLQGSAWNDGKGPWRFYVNFGILFDGVPPRRPDRDFPGTHCWTRIENLVRGAPSELELSDNQEDVARRLAKMIEDASTRVGREVDGLRRRYKEQGSPRLVSGA